MTIEQKLNYYTWDHIKILRNDHKEKQLLIQFSRNLVFISSFIQLLNITKFVFFTLDNKLFPNTRWRKDCMHCYYFSSSSFFSELHSKPFPLSCWHSSNCTSMGSRLRLALSCTSVDRGILFVGNYPGVHCAWCIYKDLWTRFSSSGGRRNSEKKEKEINFEQKVLLS